MESYIEVTFLTNLLICILAYYTSAYFSLSKVNTSSYFVYMILEQIITIVLFYEPLYFLFYIYECIFYYCVFHKNIKKGFMYICLKYLYMFTYFKIYSGSFHLFHYFVPINAYVYISWPILILLIIIFKKKWSFYLKVSDFIYDLLIYADEKIYVKAFLDTGNNVKYKDIPVFFLDASYKCKFIHCHYENVYIKSINGSSVCQVALCEIRINKYKKGWAYINCDKDVLLEWNCRCLLNMEL